MAGHSSALRWRPGSSVRGRPGDPRLPQPWTPRSALEPGARGGGGSRDRPGPDTPRGPLVDPPRPHAPAARSPRLPEPGSVPALGRRPPPAPQTRGQGHVTRDMAAPGPCVRPAPGRGQGPGPLPPLHLSAAFRGVPWAGRTVRIARSPPGSETSKRLEAVTAPEGPSLISCPARPTSAEGPRR